MVSENRAVHAEDVITLLDVLSPPVFLEVLFEFSAEWAVVPATIESAVEFCGLVDEAFALTEGDNFLHLLWVSIFSFSHGKK